MIDALLQFPLGAAIVCVAIVAIVAYFVMPE